MYRDIMNDSARMLSIKSRNGLNIKQGSNAVEQHLKTKQIQRETKDLWNRIKIDFEQKYSNVKKYDFHFIRTFIDTIPTMSPGMLNKLYNSVLNNDLENYLLRRMEIKKDQLVFRNTALTQW